MRMSGETKSMIWCESLTQRVHASRASSSHEIDYHADLILILMCQMIEEGIILEYKSSKIVLFSVCRKSYFK